MNDLASSRWPHWPGSVWPGFLLASLILAFNVSAQSRNAIATGDHHADAVPLCGSGSDASQSGFYSDMMKVNARMHEAMQTVPSGDVDRDFMQMMIAHHQGAIDMALVVLKYGRDEKVKRLAQSIIVE